MKEEIRFAQQSDIADLKGIWKLCFGDSDWFVDFYYANRFKEARVLLLLLNKEISAMLTIIPIRMVSPEGQRFQMAMLYAIATHPRFQKRGLATRLIDFTNQHLEANNIKYSVLVPAEGGLFDFYRKQDYQDGFNIRELLLTHDQINGLCSQNSPCLYQCTISPIGPKEYNIARDKQLSGEFYIAYPDEDIDYQKKLSQHSGADIFAINMSNEIKGCLAVERMDSERVLIKEILVSNECLLSTIQQVVALFPAAQYTFRMPVFLGSHLGGSIRSFGMVRGNGKSDLDISTAELGYLGFAFD